MFKKTRIRLVILNSIVFFIILNCFGATLYFYMQHRLYNEADVMLNMQASHFKHGDFRDLLHFRGGQRGGDRRVVYILWDDKGQVRTQIPTNALFPEDIPKLKSILNSTEPKTVSLGPEPFRVLNIPIREEFRGQFSDPTVQNIMLIHSLGPEEEMLESLLGVIILGGIISIAVGVVIGLFLANRALIPIQRAWNKQQEFTANASHELRTPLTVMKLNLERLFRHPDHTIEQASASISDILRENRRMSRLVQDLLTLARSDSNQTELLKQKLQLDDLMEQVIQQFQEVALMKNIAFHSNIEKSIEVVGDGERLHQMMVILLDNAMKYTKEEGTVAVSCQKIGNMVKIVVQDSGIGIPKEDLPFIFERFYRGDKARNRKYEGTGLGLSIAEWVIKSHGGKIRVESEVSVGTSFIIQLPLKTKI